MNFLCVENGEILGLHLSGQCSFTARLCPIGLHFEIFLVDFCIFWAIDIYYITTLNKFKNIFFSFDFLFFQVFNRDEPDREKTVHVTVKATDNGRPQLEDVCTLKIKVNCILISRFFFFLKNAFQFHEFFLKRSPIKMTIHQCLTELCTMCVYRKTPKLEHRS